MSGSVSSQAMRSAKGVSRAARAPVPDVSWIDRCVIPIGKRLVGQAIGRIRFGQLTLIDGDRQIASPATSDVGGAPCCQVIVHHPAVYSAAVLGGRLGLAESYMEGHWTCDDLPGLIELLTVNRSAMMRLEDTRSLWRAVVDRILAAAVRNSPRLARRHIAAHYDLSNEFFALFLDPSMTYSCAIFENGATSLADAQVEKIDRACRKLALNASDHLLEIGTGWGALAVHAARHYGCRVTTTTISERQHEFAARRIREAGLTDRIKLLKQDYRDLAGSFDKLVSIEMIEAVGRAHYGDFFKTCDRLLKPSGAALIQSIVIRDQFFDAAARTTDFLKKHIFPGSCLPSVAAMQREVAERTTLRLWHLEDIGPHYATTLAMWRETFLARRPEVLALGFDERFVRMWDYYLAYCEGAFRARHVGDVQMLLTKPMYRGAPVSPATIAPGKSTP